MLESRDHMPLDAESSLPLLISALDGKNNARYLQMASLTIMVYDYFLTIDEEVGPNYHP